MTTTKATTMKRDARPDRMLQALAAAALLAAALDPAAAAGLPGGVEVRFELSPAAEQAGPPAPALGVFPVQLVLDDGTAEGTVGVANANGAREFLWFNRFAWPGQPFDLEEVWVLFPPGVNMAVGAAVELAVYRDDDGDPSNGADLLATYAETIQTIDGVTFSVYPLAPPVTFTDPGDVLIGVVPRFIDPGDPPTSPAAVDTTASQQRSWIAIWTGDPPDPPALPPDLLIDLIDNVAPAAAGNWMVRGFGGPPPVAVIPSLDGSGLAALALLLAAAGFVVLRRLRRRHLAALGVVALAAAAALASATPAAAQVVIDEFSTSQATVSDPPGGGSTAVTGGADILGGKRGLRVRNLAGPGPTSIEVAGGALDFSVAATTPDSRGEADVIWDGDADNDPATFDPAGLGAVDLTGGGTQGGIRIVVEQAQAGTHFSLSLWEDAGHVSRAGRVLPAIASTTTIFINFGELIADPDAIGPADPSQIGAVTLRLGAVESPSAPTLRISRIETAPPAVAALKIDTVGGTPVGGPQAPGTTIRYRVTITNPGAGGAEGVDFSDVVSDPDLGTPGAARTTPLARRDQYVTVTDTPIDSASDSAPSLLANDVDPDGNPLAAVAATGQATSQGGSVDVAADGDFVYTPPAGFVGVDSFTYTLQATAGDPTADAAGNPIGPIGSTAYVIVDRVPPVITAGGTLNYTESDPPTAIDPALTVVDVDSPNLFGATVQITGNYADPEDVLAFTDTANITGNWVPATATLTLTGTDTVANYQAALRSVTYENTSEAPSTATRTVTWTATDGTETSAPATSTIEVTSVNDAPVITTSGGVTSFTEDGGPVVVDSALTVTDADDANLESATVSLASAPDGGLETLGVVSPGTNCPGLAVTPGNPLTITGSQPIATYQSCLRAVTYDNTDQDPDTANRTVQFVANDGDDDSNVAVKTVTVTAVNDLIVFTTDPIAYTTPGNTQLHVAGRTRAGVAAHSDPLGALAKSGPTDVDGPAAPAVVPFAGATPNGFVDVIADGSFHYVPNAGFTGVDTFTVQVTDGVTPVNLTINMTVAETVWYVRDVVDANNPAGGDGRSTDAFETLTAAAAASVTPDDYIFVFAGNTAVTPLTGGVALEDGEKLHGEGVGLTVAGFPQLVAPGARPRVRTTAASTDVVRVPATAANRQNVEIRGLDLEATGATSNAVDATASGAFLLGVRISENTIRGATAEGVDVNAGSSGAALLAIHDNSVTATGTGIDVQRTGAGAVTITAFDDNTVTAASAGTGILVNGGSGPVAFDATAGGAFNQVAGGVTAIGAPGDGVGGAGMILTNVAGDLAFSDLDVFADGGAGVRISGTGAVNVAAGTGARVTVVAGVGVVEATGGPAIDLSAVTADFRLTGLKSTSTATTGVSLVNVSDAVNPAFNAAFSAGSGSTITSTAGATGPLFNVSGGNAAITYSGTITNTGTGRAVSIATWAGDDAGDDLVLSGAIDENGSGILVNGNGGSRAITFSGGMDIDTTTGEGFAATSNTNTLGLHITGTNTIDSVSAAALRVTNTTIGTSNLNFRSISSGNNTAAADPANGIVLSNTGSSGGLIVTGNGGACTEGSSTCSGGWIQNMTGGDDSSSTPVGTGIVLNNTANVSLTRMRINDTSNYGIRGTSVAGFTFANGVVDGANGTNVSTPFNDGSMVFFGVTGTSSGMTGISSITNSTIMGGRQRNIAIDNSVGTLNLTVSGNTIKRTSDAAGDDGFFLEADTTASVTVGITNNLFARHGGDHINLSMLNSAVVVATITGNTLHGNYAGTPEGNHPIGLGQGIFILGATFNGTFTYQISNNGTVAVPFRGNRQGGAIHVNKGSGTGTFSGSIENNVIGDPAVTGSGSSEAFGIIVGARGAGGSHTTLINNNLVRQYFDRGIVLEAGEGGAALNATVTSNTVSNFADAVNSLHGIHSDNGILPADTNAVCLQISGNSVATAGNEPAGGADIRLRRGSSTTVRLPGIGGTTNADATTLLQSNNPTATTITVTGNGFSNGPACPLP